MCKRLRTDSIYTLRQTPTNYKQRIFWWQRGKGKDKEEEVAAIKIISCIKFIIRLHTIVEVISQDTLYSGPWCRCSETPRGCAEPPRACGRGGPAQLCLPQQQDPDDQVHLAQLHSQEPVRAVPPLCQPLLPLHRPAQLGACHQRLWQGDLHDPCHPRPHRDSSQGPL